jgi:hypothetical protein
MCLFLFNVEVTMLKNVRLRKKYLEVLFKIRLYTQLQPRHVQSIPTV